MEVAQIAKSIAIKLNATESFFRKNPLDTDLIETAALAHDLGHPPFGHNGEEALDECMADFGGFEGNAQTLRILGKLEKKRTFYDDYEPVSEDGKDKRAGLNLTARTLAATLKYDREIPRRKDGREKSGVIKGYYHTDRDLVAFIKKSVLGDKVKMAAGSFKTVECSIMDVADDIAYSTYDIEDAFKGELLSPIDLIAASPDCLESVAATVNNRLDLFYGESKSKASRFTKTDARDVFVNTFAELFDVSPKDVSAISSKAPQTKFFLEGEDSFKAFLVASASDLGSRVAADGYRRTQFTSALVGKFIHGVEFLPNKHFPQLGRVRLKEDAFKEVETFKVFAFESLISSSRLKLAEFSGKSIVAFIFKTLNEKRGNALLPEDFRALHEALAEPDEKARVICDFVAGMTDKYAIEFYARLTSADKNTFWKPL